MLNDGSSTYLYGPTRFATVDSLGTRTWALHDALGSVRQVLGDAGAALSPTGYAYTPFGVVRSGAEPAPFGFTGELQSDDLVYLRARWYDPASGTFLGRDPFAGFERLPYSLHPYQYGYSDPVRYTDPTGLCATGAVVDTVACGAVALPVTAIGLGAAQIYYLFFHPNAAEHQQTVGRGFDYSIDYVFRGGQGYVWTGGGAATAGAPPRHTLPPLVPDLPDTPSDDAERLTDALEQLVDSICTDTRTEDDNDRVYFYSVQGSSDAIRLRTTGEPWPTEPHKSSLGEGVYAWATQTEAEHYRRILSNRPNVSSLEVMRFSIEQGVLASFNSFDVDAHPDPEAWMTRYAKLWGGTPDHGHQYVRRGTRLGVEHFFDKSVFPLLHFE